MKYQNNHIVARDGDETYFGIIWFLIVQHKIEIEQKEWFTKQCSEEKTIDKFPDKCFEHFGLI